MLQIISQFYCIEQSGSGAYKPSKIVSDIAFNLVSPVVSDTHFVNRPVPPRYHRHQTMALPWNTKVYLCTNVLSSLSRDAHTNRILITSAKCYFSRSFINVHSLCYTIFTVWLIHIEKSKMKVHPCMCKLYSLYLYCFTSCFSIINLPNNTNYTTCVCAILI